jgi:hypothetical protein
MEAAVEGDELLGFRLLILAFSFLPFAPIFVQSDVSFEDVPEGFLAKS